MFLKLLKNGEVRADYNSIKQWRAMMKKVVILFGSPRKNSNTYILTKEMQRGLTDQKVESHIFYLNDMNIKGCQACYYCKSNNIPECAIKDDMQLIYKAMKEADGIIVATPIYFGDVTAQTKIWLDRQFSFIDMNVNSLIPKGKKASFIFTQNQPDPTVFVEHTTMFKQMVGFLGFEIKDTLLASNIDKDYKPMVSENKKVMNDAYELGKTFFNV
jgi:multimeric flavodoxin WrbA